jgi:hypothetical protein
MAELVHDLAALAMLYGVGLFYWRLGGWLWRTGRQATRAASPAAGVADLPQDSRYETALATARAVIRQFADRPDMQGHERLSSVTYAILEAFYRLEGLRQAGRECPEPSVN